MSFEAIISLVAALISVSSVCYNIWLNRRLIHNDKMQSLSNLIELERSMADIPSAFQFHNISEEDIKKAGITPQELAYLVASITAGGVYHRTNDPNGSDSFKPGSYRYNMSSSQSFQKAWPLIKRMMNPSSYTARIDKTIQEINS